MNLKEKREIQWPTVQNNGPLSLVRQAKPSSNGLPLVVCFPRLPFSFASPALSFLITRWQGQTDRTLSLSWLLPDSLPPCCPSSYLSSTLSLGHLTPCSEENHMEILARTFRSAQKSKTLGLAAPGRENRESSLGPGCGQARWKKPY